MFVTSRGVLVWICLKDVYVLLGEIQKTCFPAKTTVNYVNLLVAASAPVSERSVKVRKTKRLTGSTRLGFIVPTFTAIPL